jgi:tRNA threonylcarbamoyladenosine biosynthesis protein TsaB
MNLLAIDTSSSVASVAIFKDEKLIAEYTTNYKKNHSERLVPMIADVMKDVEMKPKDMDVFAVSIGPGSFTGLRIGVATIKAMAHSLNKKVIGAPTLECAAYNVPFCNGIVCSVVNALRGEVFGAIYRWDKDKLVEIFSPALLTIENYILKASEFAQNNLADGLNNQIVVVNEGTQIIADYLSNKQDKYKELNIIIPGETVSMLKASSVGIYALNRIKANDFDDLNNLSPVYMRKSAAEEKADEKLLQGEEE